MPTPLPVHPWLRLVALGLLLLAGTFPVGSAAPAQPVIPPRWDIVSEDFESGSLDAWQQESPANLYLAAGAGRQGSTALAVVAGAAAGYLYQVNVAKSVEGYMTFWFNPNGVVIPDEGTPWVPGKSICLAAIVNSADWWPPLAALYVRSPAGQGYQAYLAWPIDEQGNRFYDYAGGSFELLNGWQKLTVGYRIDSWVAVWHNDVLVRYATDVVHPDPYGDIIQFGKTNSSSNVPTGTMLWDDYAFQVPRVDDLWVDAADGNDDHDGLTPATAYRSIQKAADGAGPGTTVHIQPGVYRETVWPAMNGSAAEPVRYIAEEGPGTAILRGSEPSSTLPWIQLTGNSIGLPPGVDPANVYYTELAAWELAGPPRFVVELDSAGQVLARYPLAREPDWQVTTEWKHHEFWWAADGGASPADCDPASNDNHHCDLPSRSTTQLTDRTSDADPPGVEPGNLTTLGNLTGATLVAIDTYQGHYVYRRTITAHDVGAGRITVDRICEHDGGSGNPGLGWGSKYYVEGLPYLLDSPGEWWYDAASGRLYLWPRTPGDPAAMEIEISRRDNGFSLRNRSDVTLDGLTIEFVNDSAIYLANWQTHKSYRDTVRNATLRYANWGLYIEQSVTAGAPPGNVIDGFTLEDSEVAYIDSLAIRLIDWWENGADPNLFTRSGILNTTIRGNELHHLGFRPDSDNAVGVSFGFANKLRFVGNHVHHVAHNGVQISRSVIQSPHEYGFAPDEIKTGEILVQDNIFEKACQLTTDCGGLKFWGDPPDNHVFRDVLVTGNVFRDSMGWTYVSEKRQRWMGGQGSDVRGLGAFGLYVDHASGIHAYRNVAYNNAYAGFMLSGVWRDGEIVYYNNTAANSLYGLVMGSGYDTHGSVNTQVVNNILVNNEGFGAHLSYTAGQYQNMTVDYNLYAHNGWRSADDGGFWHAGPMVVRESGSWTPYETLAEAQAATPWEDHGLEGDPAFWDYNPADHDLHDGSWPDFHLTAASGDAIDRGTTVLPASLTALLELFGAADAHWGRAYDIGRYEGGFALTAAPSSQAIAPGGTAHYRLELAPAELPHAVTLTAASPAPSLTVALAPTVISPGTAATLTVTDTYAGPLPAGLWYTLPITGAGGGFMQPLQVELLVSGWRVYLPLILTGAGGPSR